MSFWADQFVEVCYQAQQFHVALEEARHPISAVCLLQRREVARARTKLECAMALYQLCRPQKTE